MGKYEYIIWSNVFTGKDGVLNPSRAIKILNLNLILFDTMSFEKFLGTSATVINSGPPQKSWKYATDYKRLKY